MTGSDSGVLGVLRANAAPLAACLVVLVLGVAVLVALGVGPVGDADDGPAGTTPTETRPPGDGEGPGPTPEDASTPSGRRPVSLAIQAIEECGQTCRDVTVSLTNEGERPRTGITVATTIYTGGDEIWAGEETVGTLDAEETATRTERVDVGFFGGVKIERNGGTVTIETVVRWDGGSVTFSERRTVA